MPQLPASPFCRQICCHSLRALHHSLVARPSTFSCLQPLVLQFLSLDLTMENRSLSARAQFHPRYSPVLGTLRLEGSWSTVDVGRIGFPECCPPSRSTPLPHTPSLCTHTWSFTNPPPHPHPQVSPCKHALPLPPCLTRTHSHCFPSCRHGHAPLTQDVR